MLSLGNARFTYTSTLRLQFHSDYAVLREKLQCLPEFAMGPLLDSGLSAC